MTGQIDSVVAVTNRVIAKDTTASTAALDGSASADQRGAGHRYGTGRHRHHRHHYQGLGAQRRTQPGCYQTPPTAVPTSRAKEALPFLEFAIKYGDPQAKENAAALLYTGGAKLLQQPQDLPGAAELLRLAVQSANPTGKVGPAANYLLGPGDPVPGAADRSAGREAEVLRHRQQMETLLTEAETALTAGRAANAEAVDKNLGIIKQYKPRVASMQKAYCK